MAKKTKMIVIDSEGGVVVSKRLLKRVLEQLEEYNDCKPLGREQLWKVIDDVEKVIGK